MFCLSNNVYLCRWWRRSAGKSRPCKSKLCSGMRNSRKRKIGKKKIKLEIIHLHNIFYNKMKSVIVTIISILYDVCRKSKERAHQVIQNLLFMNFWQEICLLTVLFVYDMLNWQINNEQIKKKKLKIRRIEYELFDYPGSGANDRHSPWSVCTRLINRASRSEMDIYIL